MSASAESALSGEQRTLIFWTPHKSRNRKREFVKFLAPPLGGDLVNRHFEIDPGSLDCHLDARELIACLEAVRCLPAVKRQPCIDALKKLPALIRVAREPSRISFDSRG